MFGKVDAHKRCKLIAIKLYAGLSFDSNLLAI